MWEFISPGSSHVPQPRPLPRGYVQPEDSGAEPMRHEEGGAVGGDGRAGEVPLPLVRGQVGAGDLKVFI